MTSGALRRAPETQNASGELWSAPAARKENVERHGIPLKYLTVDSKQYLYVQDAVPVFISPQGEMRNLLSQRKQLQLLKKTTKTIKPDKKATKEESK